MPSLSEARSGTGFAVIVTDMIGNTNVVIPKPKGELRKWQAAQSQDF
jgi:hypothetical protein